MFVADGYIRVFQDIRGKYGSEGDYVMTRPLRGPLNPSDSRSLHRRVRHHRLAREERARIERARRHARQLLRRLHRRHGAGESASGAEGGGAREPDGGRLDGRRLVPLRRVPPVEPRLLHGPDAARAARARSSRAWATTTTTTSCAPARPATSRSDAGLDQLPCVAQGHRASGLRQLLAASRRSTKSWPRSRSRCRRCGFRGCGIRKTCGARSTATRRSSRRTPATTRTIWSWARGATAR